MKVFLSSTCYDLIDLRAEVVNHLREQGISVMASDDMQSDFQVHHGVNSIETCLVNVRDCDYFVIVLDQRYGPLLGSFGYEDVSATHLEYKEAVRAGKPIHFFVRDRLEADYKFRQRNRGQQTRLPWVKEQHDQKIFNLLEEHEKSRGSTSNWYSIFTNSVDLKRTLSLRFRDFITPGKLAKLISENHFPILDLIVDSTGSKSLTRKSHGVILKLILRNLGYSPAFSLEVNATLYEDERTPETVYSSKCCGPFTKDSSLSFEVDFFFSRMVVEDLFFYGRCSVTCTYNSIFGIRVCDEFDVALGSAPDGIVTKVDLQKREYFYGEPIRIEIKEPSEQTSSDSLDQLPPLGT